MTEATLKSALVRELHARLPAYVVIRHEDKFTHGVPDLSITGCGHTSWWEAKYANPSLDLSGIQNLMMLRLETRGCARFIFFYDGALGQRTYVIRPTWLIDRATGLAKPEWNIWPYAAGFAYGMLCEEVQRVHEGRTASLAFKSERGRDHGPVHHDIYRP